MNLFNKNKKVAKLSFLSRLMIGEERDYFIENLAVLLASGMDILSALRALKTEMRTRQMKKIIDSMIEDIDVGSYIWRALKKTNLMPEQTLALIRIGEEAGQLAENLRVIALQQQKERVFRSKLRSAMTYPILVLTLTLVIGLGITWFILPRLSTVFDSLNIELPLITKILIAIGNFLGQFGFFVIPAFLIVLSTAVYFVFIFKKTKFIGEAILLAIPIIKKLVKQVELARFGFILGTLLKAGLPVLQAINSLEQSTTIRTYKKFYRYLQDSVEEGNSFQKSFSVYKQTNKLMPSSMEQMIIAGEKSGRLAETLIKVGQAYEEKTETTTKNLTVILEPILLIIIWLGVVAVALAVILPIYSLIGGLNAPKNTTPPSTTTPAPAVEQINTLPQADTDDAAAGLEVIKDVDQLEILSTPVGFLNIRQDPNTTSNIIDQAEAGNIYEYIDEEDGWYEIVLSEDETGWVFGQYVEMQYVEIMSD